MSGGAGLPAVTGADWDARVLEAGRPVLVDFWAPWCAPCIRLEPALAEVAERYAGRVDVTTLDVDDQPAVAGRYDVLQLPTVMLFDGGAPVARLTVRVTPRTIEDAVAGHLAHPD
ncbi:MAG: thioredoxin family protein [Thermoleophilia bacterium]